MTFSSHKWLQKALSTQIDNSVIVIDTKNVYDRSVAYQRSLDASGSNAPDRPNTRIYQNYCEAAIILYILRALIVVGIIDF